MSGPPDMKVMVQAYLNTLSPNMMVMVLLFVLLFFVILYIYQMVKKEDYNCRVIASYPFYNMKPLTNEILDSPLNKVYIKTAYNCCCTGEFKNDYVNSCALLNCAKQGVRALDFTVYSLKGAPVIAASTISSNRYKEMYNSMSFSKTMTQVKQMFIYDTVNCTNTSDPLFLIFRIQSANKEIYNMMGDSLSSIFGDGSGSASKIYVPTTDNPLDNIKISNLKSKVIILVDITGLNGFANSKLIPITALQLGTMTNQIYRESDAYDLLESGINKNETYVNVLYPDYQSKNVNYDFNTVGLKQNFQFIGLNFQMNDIYLDGYNKFFTSSIVLQPKTSTKKS